MLVELEQFKVLYKIRSNLMTEKKSKMNEGKRLPQGLRKHIRRLKQEARNGGTVYRAPIIKRVPVKTAES